MKRGRKGFKSVQAENLELSPYGKLELKKNRKDYFRTGQVDLSINDASIELIVQIHVDQSELWIVLEPKFDVISIFNFLPRFTITQNEISWSNMEGTKHSN